MIPVRDYLKESKIIHNRIIFLFGFVSLLALILVARLVHLQVSQHQHFSTLAQNNRIDIISLPPVRGLIYDRNGEVLAQNFRVYNLEILPDKVENMDETLGELRQLIDLSDDNIKQFKTLLKRRPSFERQTLRANLKEDEAARLAVNQHRYPGIELRARLQRNYPKGELISHVVGYVGRISSEDLAQIDNKRYRGLEYIGKSGIESYYESSLLGKSGVQRAETNAHGRVVRSLEQTEPVSGETMYLGLDIKLQRKSIEALEGFEGAVVAIEPETGDILAFVSVPSFDPNPFVNGITKKNYDLLRSSPRTPLLNRALYGRYAPGSTIKGFISLVGIKNDISHDTQIFCPGWFSLPGHKHRYRDWKKTGHAQISGHSAIVESCDVYYYRLAKRLGIDRLHEGMTHFGFGKESGVDLPGEPSGLMPSRKWKRRARNQPWYPGETVITGIGQGYMLVTPLQLASATAMLANRGDKVQPRFLTAVENPQSQLRREIAPVFLETNEGVSQKSYRQIINSMKDVIHGDKGTARRINEGIKYQMAGKTGTAQVKSIAQNEKYDEENVEKKFKDHSLFVGFAPLDNPKIAIAVVVEHGGSGSRTAAPIARKLIDYYLLNRLGMFQEEADDVNG
ncbi:MAG: penicillin-binding protein 2 [Gammaproteobacteria bacterium]|nr:penicillin-binding protein 2 [Gammaproteobacteria bacterium]